MSSLAARLSVPPCLAPGIGVAVGFLGTGVIFQPVFVAVSIELINSELVVEVGDGPPGKVEAGAEFAGTRLGLGTGRGILVGEVMVSSTLITGRIEPAGVAGIRVSIDPAYAMDVAAGTSVGRSEHATTIKTNTLHNNERCFMPKVMHPTCIRMAVRLRSKRMRGLAFAINRRCLLWKETWLR